MKMLDGGALDLRAMTFRQRARALIAIATLEHRAPLQEQAAREGPT